MFCHAGSRPPAAMRRGMSCFVCERCICCVPFRHEAAVSDRGAGVSVRLSRLCVFGMGPSVRRRFVPPAPPPLARQRRNPSPARIARVRACARPRALRGGAVRAPDCAFLPQAPCPTPGRRLRKPVAQGRLAAVATVQPKAALQRRYPLDKTRPLLPKHRVPCLQARNLLLQTPGYRHRQRLSLRSATAHLQVHSCSKHTVNLPTIGNLPGSHVMFCHVPHAQAAYAAAVSGMKPAAQPLPLRLPRDSRAPHRRPSQSRISFLHPVPFRSVLPAAGPPRAAEPCFARIARVRACAWLRAFRGGARIARLIAPACARAREAGVQAHLSRPFSKRCFFRAGAKRRREQPRAAAAPLLTAQS